MWFLIGFIIVCYAFYRAVYKGWSFKGKLVFKIVLLCLTIFFTVLMVIMVIWSVKGAFEAEKEKSLANRLSMVERRGADGNYPDMAFRMNLDMDYEPEFDYMWERLQMYASYNRYVVFMAAEEREALAGEFAGKAEYYKKECIRLCENPTCPENEEFGEYYLEQKGLAD